MLIEAKENKKKKDTNLMTNYTYSGARVLIALHDQHMRSCLEVWKQAKKAGIVLPETTDPSYKSMETLLFHLLRASRNYIVWICEKLELPDPGIDTVPDLKHIEQSVDAYLEHLLQRWQLPLRDVPEERFFDRTYLSRWDVEYCIESMLEHAVMHAIRHEYQLGNLMKAQGEKK